MPPAGSVPPPCPPRPPSSSSGGVLQIAFIEVFKVKLITLIKSSSRLSWSWDRHDPSVFPGEPVSSWISRTGD